MFHLKFLCLGKQVKNLPIEVFSEVERKFSFLVMGKENLLSSCSYSTVTRENLTHVYFLSKILEFISNFKFIGHWFVIAHCPSQITLNTYLLSLRDFFHKNTCTH